MFTSIRVCSDSDWMDIRSVLCVVIICCGMIAAVSYLVIEKKKKKKGEALNTGIDKLSILGLICGEDDILPCCQAKVVKRFLFVCVYVLEPGVYIWASFWWFELNGRKICLVLYLLLFCYGLIAIISFWLWGKKGELVWLEKRNYPIFWQKWFYFLEKETFCSVAKPGWRICFTCWCSSTRSWCFFFYHSFLMFASTWFG